MKPTDSKPRQHSHLNLSDFIFIWFVELIRHAFEAHGRDNDLPCVYQAALDSPVGGGGEVEPLFWESDLFCGTFLPSMAQFFARKEALGRPALP